MRKTLAAAGAAVVVGLVGATGVGLASAQSSSTSGNSLVDKIASTFNLNKADVQKVFDEDRADHEAQRAADIKTKLDAAVKDGKLTQAQEDALIAKFKEMKATMDANRDAMQNKTDAERKAAMDAQRTAFQKWLTDNNIPEEYARFGMGGHGHGFGHGGPGDGTPPPSDNSTSTN